MCNLCLTVFTASINSHLVKIPVGEEGRQAGWVGGWVTEWSPPGRVN